MNVPPLELALADPALSSSPIPRAVSPVGVRRKMLIRRARLPGPVVQTIQDRHGAPIFELHEFGSEPFEVPITDVFDLHPFAPRDVRPPWSLLGRTPGFRFVRVSSTAAASASARDRAKVLARTAVEDVRDARWKPAAGALRS